jgi:hypothetical protein
MATELCNPAIDHYRNPVGIVRGVQSVRDRDHSAVLQQRYHRALQMSSRMRVDQ